MSTPINNMEVKRRNRANTLRYILSHPYTSQPEAAKALSLSRPTVLKNVNELVEMGLAREVGTNVSTGGRKARLYAAVRDAKLAVGLDVTKNHLGLVLIDLSGQVVRYTRKKHPFTMTDDYFQGIGDLVREFLEGLAPDRILGVGVSLPGIVNEAGDRLLYSHIMGIHDVPTGVFGRYVGYPCTYLNDANAAAIAEVWGNPTKGCMVYLSLSNSVGGAIVYDRELYAGNNLRAGEFGHVTLVPGGRQCYCGKFGCVDAYCSAKVLANHVPDGQIVTFFEKLKEGDPELRAVWKTYLEDLSVVINNLRMSFDADVIAGGYVGGYLEEYGPSLRDMLRQRNTFQMDDSYFRCSHYRLEASAVGAALTYVEQFIQKLG